jgi:elongation factor P
MKATNIRKGQLIRHNGQIYKVMVMDHVTPGKGRAHVQTKLRNLIEGTQTEVRFRSDEDVERVVVDTRQMQYLYGDGDGYHFMDTESYEQIALTSDTLGEAMSYIVPDSTIMVEWVEGTPVGVDIGAAVELRVLECPPAVKDATASAQRKPATTETGLVVQVPSFINEGDVIKVSTADGSYLERASK